MPELLKSVLVGFVVFFILTVVAGTISSFELLIILLISFGAGRFRHRRSRRRAEFAD